MNILKGKLIIKADLKLLTGLHIGTSGAFAAIGAVDSIVVRDPYTKEPIIPGSSLKGKMRYLLSRVTYRDVDTLEKIIDESTQIKRLFGSSNPLTCSRLQFQDIHLTQKSSDELKQLDLDLPYTEIKFENTIDRATGEANPRQLERVPAGSIFEFRLVYNIEDELELEEDLRNIKKVIEVLQYDYLGGHGTRGYGRVIFEGIDIELKKYSDDLKVSKESALTVFQE